MCGRCALYTVLAVGLATDAIAGERAQVDLSLEVVVSPRTFMPGGRNVVTLAVHNSEPDVAGASLPDSESIYLLIDQFFIADGGAPFEIRGPVSGCRAEEILGEPNISVTYAFWFGPIASGETQRCTYWLEFYPWIVESFPTAWQVFTPNDDDTDHSNDRVDFVFQPAGAAPAAVSTLSSLVVWILAGLMLAAALLFGRTRRKTTTVATMLLWTSVAHAEFGVPYITPPHPIAGETISLNIYQGGCDGITGPDKPQVTLDGSFIYVLAQGVRYTNPELCFLGYGTATFAIGSYAAGHYTMQLDLRYANPGGNFVIETLGVVPFTVSGAPAVAVVVPTSGTFWLAMLAALMCLVSARRFSRR